MTGEAFGELVADCRAGWIADAASLCRSLAWHCVGNEGTVHVLDAAALPPEASATALGWTLPGADIVLRPLLRDRRSGPVLVLNAGGIVRERLTPETLTRDEAAALGRLEVAQVALHELGHAVARGSRGHSSLEGVTIALLSSVVGQPQAEEHHRRSHGREWVRAYVHVSDRAARLVWPRGWWLDACRHDLRVHGHGQADELVAALQPELGTDEPLADVLSRDCPPAFASLFSDETH